MTYYTPAWVLDIPYEDLMAGRISKEEFMHKIKNNPTIPSQVVRNWENYFEREEKEGNGG